MEKPERPNVRSRVNPSGKRVYFLDYPDPTTGKRVRLVIGSVKRDAEKKADQLYREMMGRYVGEPEDSFKDVSLKELADLYFRTKQNRIAPTSVRRYQTFANNFLQYMTEEFPTVDTASKVERRYVEMFLEKLSAAEMKPKTINNQIFVIKAMFKFAVSEGFIRESKVETIKRFRNRQQDKHPEFWSKAEIKAILDNVRPHWRDAFEFLYVTGVRVGEMINLTWNDVNLKADPPTMTIQSKGDWTAKTSGIKSIPLNSRAVVIIQRQSRAGKHDRIFKGPQGGMVKYDDIHHRLDEALKILHLTGNLHKFRHTFASHLAMKGQRLNSISELLGHRNIEQTMRYAHLAEGHLKDVSESLLEDD